MAGAFDTEVTPTELLTEATGAPETDIQNGVGISLGPYRILRVLGEGGMGTVFLAEQAEPIKRQVAVKVVKLGMDSSQVLARFNNERQSLALMDHPNVARIYDAGSTPAGRPYFVMEYIDGVPITEYCDHHRLTTQQRLKLFLPVCLALQHAHQRGVIHRDIKPSNVLVMEQDGESVPKVIDFGIARATDQRSVEFTHFTQFGQLIGTPEYMSPEQADVVAGEIDTRSDVYSLGVLLYEMLIGSVPFETALLRKAGLAELLRIIREEPAPALSKKLTTMGRTVTDVAACRHTDPATLRRQLTGDLSWIAMKVLEKDRERRYASVSHLADDIRRHLENRPVLAGPPSGYYRVRKFVHRRRLAVLTIGLALLLTLIAGASISFYRRSERRHWVREQAIPDIQRLRNENKPVAALRLMQRAQEYLPEDRELADIAETLTHRATVRSSPPGASVEVKDYLSPDDAWFPLGKTPLDKAAIPSGYLRWRLLKPGLEEYIGAPVMQDMHGYVDEMTFPLVAAGTVPKEMVPVPAGPAFSMVWSLGELGPYNLPAFYMDRFEVTNRQYQEFVDHGGYRNRQYWKEKFLRDGSSLNWEQAMAQFVDTTGQTGPSTWADGHYPAGQADYPVGGVSWYEAAAYTEFAGKSLPVIAQWFLAAPSPVAKQIMSLSNFSSSPAPVGRYQGLGPWGTYDMAGNVAEWCLNESNGARYILGGGWNTTTNEYFEPGVLPPFHRAANSGFRCVRNSGPLPAEVMAERRQTIRDFAKAKPASDAIFGVYRGMYAYDRTPLQIKVESVAQDSRDWRKEKVTFNAAYANERVTAYLFLPAHGRPPYQTVVFFPSARALDLDSSQVLTDMKFLDYVIRSGRAVLYPVYKGTYDRIAPAPGPDTAAGRETLIQDSKDLGRSIDYLETRPDIDRTRIAYMGESMGAALGVNFVGVEERFHAVIFMDGGFYSEKPLEGTDQADFLPHIKAPTLLISGKFDWIFLGKEALVRLLGSPAADKQAITLDTAHDVSERPVELQREVLAWLDTYLGRVMR